MHETGEGGGSPPAGRPRHGAGSPRGGQFAACLHAAPEGSLPDDGLDEANGSQGLEYDVLAAASPGCRPEDIARLLDPGQPAAVRLAVTLSPSCPQLTATTAARDREAPIRAMAMLNPHLDVATRTRLAEDPAVMAAAAFISGDEPVLAA